MQSYIFDFRESPSFRRKWNKEFDIEAMGETCFNIVLVDGNCDDNIEDCLNADLQLKYDESNMKQESCSLEYHVNSQYNDSIRLSSAVTFELGEEMFEMKGAFITTDSGYVMGYSINNYSVNITNQMIFEKDFVLWDIVEGGNING